MIAMNHDLNAKHILIREHQHVEIARDFKQRCELRLDTYLAHRLVDFLTTVF